MAGKNKKFNIVDLFAGVGGMSAGFKNTGFNVVSANEYDKEIAYTYEKNHPGTKIIIDDIANVKSEQFLTDKIQDIDVVIGGPPCQGFSMAGRRIRKNSFLNDPRNELFKEYTRIVKDLKPKIFVLENVAALLNMNGGSVKDEIIESFSKLGYAVSVKVLNSADYGVPQLRKRAIFIGNRIGIDSEKLFPQKTHGGDRKAYITVEDSIFDLPFIKSGSGEFETEYTKEPTTDYQKERRKGIKKLYNHIAPIHSERIIDLMKLIKEGEGRDHLPENMKTKSVHSGAYGRMNRKLPSYTITTRFDTPSVGRVTHPIVHRALTPREAARIQSFDDNFIFYGKKSSVGIQIGNAVPPLLAQAIAKYIKKELNKYHEK